ncbi:hypothetical protein, partial [Desulfovibrio sp. 1214_IL3152]|uniref:hypothetical protein n=1 Tax=Desulfovibrio sp. 1214_IL3152 TaxID=3084056 RepID=UPI002FDB422C
PAGDVRAVLYSAGDSEDHFVSTPVFFRDASGNLLNLSSGAAITRAASGPDSVSCAFSPEWDSRWLSEPEFINGQLVFKFSEAGLTKLQSLDPDDFLRGLVTVTVVKDGHVFEYTVEVVATGGSSFDSQAYDTEYGAVSGFGTESVGEYHQGSGQTGSYQIVASTGNDNINLDDTVIGGSSIHASGSADPARMADDYNTITLNAGVANTTPGSITHITSSDGKLVVADGVTAQGSGAENVIDMGKGSVHVQNVSGDGVSAADGGKNTVSGGEVVVDAGDTGFLAKDGGSNTVAAQDGDVSIDADGWGMVAQNNATNSVAATGGSVNITAGKQGLQAQGGSVNSVTTTDGDITINADWDGVAAYDNSTNNLSATNGSVSITTDTWGISSGTNSSANVDVVNGNLEIDAIGRGIHAYDDSINTVSVRDFSLGHMAASNFARSRALNGTRAGSSTSLGRGASTAQVAAIPAPVPIK